MPPGPYVLGVFFDFPTHRRFPLGTDPLESTLYLVLASLPSFVLLRESFPEAKRRDQRPQRRAVEFLGKTYHNFSPDEVVLLRCRPERQQNLQTKPDLVRGLIIVSN